MNNLLIPVYTYMCMKSIFFSKFFFFFSCFHFSLILENFGHGRVIEDPAKNWRLYKNG